MATLTTNILLVCIMALTGKNVNPSLVGLLLTWHFGINKVLQHLQLQLTLFLTSSCASVDRVCSDRDLSCYLGCQVSFTPSSSLGSSLLSLSCWQHLSSALRLVSGFCGELDFDPADDDCPWYPRKWVASMVIWILTLLTMPIFGSPVGEWLPWWIGFRPCWRWLSLAPQEVSGFHVWPCLSSAALQLVSGFSSRKYFGSDTGLSEAL